MPVIDDAPGGEPERIFVIRLLMRWMVIGSPYQGLASRVAGPVFLGCIDGAGREIMAVRFTVIGLRIEPVVHIQPWRSIRSLVVTWPLNSSRTTELCVAHPAIVARPAFRAGLPRLETFFGRRPLDQRRSIFVTKVHAPGIVDK